MEGGEALEALVAEHGFSVLVTVSKDGSQHQILFDTGASPGGVVENMRRLQVDPSDIEAIVCSHGHYDHTTGLDGLIRRLGTVNLPVLIHPQFWRRRRLVIRGRDPQEVPTTSRRALADAGFEVIEDQQPSFLFDRSVLVTGEVLRTTGYEPGLPPQQAWLGGRWEPDPLVLDEQALIVDIKDKGLLVITGCGHAGIVSICRYARRECADLGIMRPVHCPSRGLRAGCCACLVPDGLSANFLTGKPSGYSGCAAGYLEPGVDVSRCLLTVFSVTPSRRAIWVLCARQRPGAGVPTAGG